MFYPLKKHTLFTVLQQSASVAKNVSDMHMFHFIYLFLYLDKCEMTLFKKKKKTNVTKFYHFNILHVLLRYSKSVMY